MSSSTRTPPVLALYQRLSRLPMGRWLFTRAVCFKAPYFATISPLFTELSPGRAEARIRKRRRVENHLRTVHAIAMANLCELVAGTMTEVTVPVSMRWIPKGMTIEYVAKATTDVHAIAKIDPRPDFAAAADLPVTVEVMDTAGQVVVRALITMYVSPRHKGT